jgi:uncharacterized protein YceK
MKMLFIILGLLVMSGCSTSSNYKGSGTDKIHASPCAKCNKVPFYVNGQWKIKRK